ncbi:hypothetical protein [Saccharothrix sp.]|nr:hypothetical protein [Saccharothrix sp.]
MTLGPNTVDRWFAMDQPPDGSKLELVHGSLHTTAGRSTTGSR